MKTTALVLRLVGLALASSCVSAAPVSLSQKPSGTPPGGAKATPYTLTNARGASVQITDYGAIVTSLRVPDKRVRLGDVVLGFDSLQGYLKDTRCQGVIAGRIAKDRFSLHGKTYQLATNNGPNHLHGGKVGFGQKLWSARPLRVKSGPALELRLYSLSGDEGYPRNLQSRVLYTLTNKNESRMEYRAVSDAPALVNLTHHSYFNLAGMGRGTILGHKLRINANRFTPIDAPSIPLGNLHSVADTPFDFRRSNPIGARINVQNVRLKNGAGYDHNFVLNHRRGVLGTSARVEELTSGRVMTVLTTEPGLQFYSGNFLNGASGKYGHKLNCCSVFCLEAQHFPDSPNEQKFPSNVLHPGQVYRQTTNGRFPFA